MRAQDWCSEIPIKRVACECCIDPSTVTRAYQLLKAKGLIRRQDPGRDAANPFQQATAITEVRLPREFITGLGRSPNRPAIRREEGASTRSSISAPAIVDAKPETLVSAARKLTRTEMQAVWMRASAAERNRFFLATRDRLGSMEFDAETRLTSEDRAQIMDQVRQVSAARPPESAPRSAVNAPAAMKPRRLSLLETARVRARLLDCGNASQPTPELLRQVIWAIEEGALNRFSVGHAVNIALKKIREGAWTKPNRMPPNWSSYASPKRAVPESCTAA